jgi:hypothetical protein
MTAKDKDNDNDVLNIDYRRQHIPSRVREIIETHLAIESEDAKQAGALGFMTRALAIATMPHRDPGTDVFQRTNGDFTLRMLAGSPDGLPYGSLPRMLTSWATTECVRTQSPRLYLGDSLTEFMKELELARTGGKRGNITRLGNQMSRLFGTVINASFSDNESASKKRISLRNVVMFDDADIWWEPKTPDHDGRWVGTLNLNQKFFEESRQAPIPIDLRVYRVLRNSPLALDLYTWLTYRFSYLSKPSGLIRWEALANQFGSGYASDAQGLRDFKKAFLRELKRVHAIYTEARVRVVAEGINLLPSPPHVKKLPKKTTIQQLLALD